MSQGQSRSPNKELQKIPSEEKSKGKSQGKSKSKKRRIDLIKLNEKVFKLSPLLLKEDTEFTSITDDHSDTNTEDDSAPGMNEEEDSSSNTEPKDNSTLFDYDIRLDNAISCKDSAALLTNAVYTITISPQQTKPYLCWYEEPSWFNRTMGPEIEAYLDKLKYFLKAIARWFEDEKQEFLKKPCLENFMLGEAEFLEHPVIFQEDFLMRINKKVLDNYPDKKKPAEISKKGKTFQISPELDETEFSRLKDKIWLLWPEWNMPLTCLFLPENRFEWLVEVGTSFYKNSGEIWLNDIRESLDISASQLASIKEKTIQSTTRQIMREVFDELPPNEKFYLLRNKVRASPEMSKKALEMIIERVRAEK